jgi:putative PIN family toxin of toxin-antitoxin system
MRVVLDTDVLVAALRSSGGASRWLISAVLEGSITSVISVPLFLEYEAVLTRTEHLDASRLTSDQVHAVLNAVASVSEHTRLSFRWRPLLSDANDDMVLETAINGRADLLVTFNVGDFGSASDGFGCRTVLPREAIELIRSAKK